MAAMKREGRAENMPSLRAWLERGVGTGLVPTKHLERRNSSIYEARRPLFDLYPEGAV